MRTGSTATTSSTTLVSLYLDAIYLKVRPTDEPAEGVLVAWGLTLESRKILLGLKLEVDDLASLGDAGATFRNDIVTGRGGEQILLDDPSGDPIERFEPADR